MPIMAKEPHPSNAEEAIEWLKSRLADPKVPRHQHKGPFTKGPRAYVPCPICTQMIRASDPKYDGIIVGTAKQTQRRHMKDHKLGLIRKPTLAVTL